MNKPAAKRFTNPARVTMLSDRAARIERVFDAPREKVWRAHTEPALVAQWWGRGNPLDVERLEVRKGGHWRFVEHGDHGDHGFEGRFREVVPMERLSYTFEWDGMPGHVIVETLNFEATADGRTRLVVEASFHAKDDADGMLSSGMEQGMNESYEALDKVLAAM